jgi:hypothetical protein
MTIKKESAMARKIPNNGTKELEAVTLTDLIPEGKAIAGYPQEFQDARADLAVWLRYHFDNKQLELIACSVNDAISGNSGR